MKKDPTAEGGEKRGNLDSEYVSSLSPVPITWEAPWPTVTISDPELDPNPEKPQLKFNLTNNLALPQSITLTAKVGDEESQVDPDISLGPKESKPIPMPVSLPKLAGAYSSVVKATADLAAKNKPPVEAPPAIVTVPLSPGFDFKVVPEGRSLKEGEDAHFQATITNKSNARLSFSLVVNAPGKVAAFNGGQLDQYSKAGMVPQQTDSVDIVIRPGPDVKGPFAVKLVGPEYHDKDDRVLPPAQPGESRPLSIEWKPNRSPAAIPTGSVTLNPGDAIYSPDRRYKLILQTDGNLVEYDSASNALWAAGTYHKGSIAAVMQDDGNLVVYGPNNADGSLNPIWSSRTDGHRGAALRVQNDGNMVIYDASGKPLWASNTEDPSSLGRSPVAISSASNPDRLDLFDVARDGRIMSTWWEARTNKWAEWFQVSGRVASPDSPVTAIARIKERIDIFKVGTGNRVHTTGKRDDEPRWAEWETIGTLEAQPGSTVNVVARNPDQLDLFAVASDGRIMSTWWKKDIGWAEWFELGGAASHGSPVTAIARIKERIDIFTVGTGNRVHTTGKRDDDQRWAKWETIGTLEARPGSTVNVVARNPDRLDLFAVDSDGRIMSTWWQDTNGKWADWLFFNRRASPGSPVTAIARIKDQIDIFTVDKDNHVYSTWRYKEEKWGAWFPIGTLEARPGSTVNVVARNPDQLDLFAVASDNRIMSTCWKKDIGWAKWFHLAGGNAGTGA